MAWAYSDSGLTTQITVPSIAGLNYFSGQQIFSDTTASTSVSTGAVKVTGGLAIQGNLRGSEVWGAIWNDLADCIIVQKDLNLEPGYAYCFDGNTYYKSTKYLDSGFIGIHSDTAGFVMGHKPEYNQLYAAVAGFVLAYVDKEYTVGTPLTVTEDGKLTAIKEEDLAENYHKVVGTFWKKENSEKWGPISQEVNVNGRMWIKVK